MNMEENRVAGRGGKENVQDFTDRRGERLRPSWPNEERSLSVRINGRIARGTSKLGLVVPTGFEPVFQSRPCVCHGFHYVRCC